MDLLRDTKEFVNFSVQHGQGVIFEKLLTRMKKYDRKKIQQLVDHLLRMIINNWLTSG